jgi:hypothetical protein
VDTARGGLQLPARQRELVLEELDLAAEVLDLAVVVRDLALELVGWNRNHLPVERPGNA